MRVNNREYQSEGVVESEVLAREAAAKRAYLLCRNFSVSDGVHPGTSPNAIASGNGTSPPSQRPVSSPSLLAGGSLVPPHRGYLVTPSVRSGYVTGSLVGQGNLPMDNGASGRMMTPQGVVVVGHSHMGV